MNLTRTMRGALLALLAAPPSVLSAAPAVRSCRHGGTCDKPPAAQLGGALLQTRGLHTTLRKGTVEDSADELAKIWFAVPPGPGDKQNLVGGHANRSQWFKALRCRELQDMTSCEECSGTANCFHHSSDGDFVVDATDSTFVRHLLVVHLSCPTQARIHYKLPLLHGGRFRALWDWNRDFVEDQLGNSTSSQGSLTSPMMADAWSALPLNQRYCWMTFKPDVKGGHELVFEFLPKGLMPSMRLKDLSAEYEPQVQKCMDTTMCVHLFGSASDGPELRTTNEELRQCLIKKGRSSKICGKWYKCLKTNTVRHKLLLMLQAMGVGQPQIRAPRRETKDDGQCIDPLLADPMQWTCDCGDDISANLEVFDRNKLPKELRTSKDFVRPLKTMAVRKFLCERVDVCASWKTTACGAWDSDILGYLTEPLASQALMERRVSQKLSDEDDSLELTTGNKRCIR